MKVLHIVKIAVLRIVKLEKRVLNGQGMQPTDSNSGVVPYSNLFGRSPIDSALGSRRLG